MHMIHSWARSVISTQMITPKGSENCTPHLAPTTLGSAHSDQNEDLLTRGGAGCNQSQDRAKTAVDYDGFTS